MTQTKILIVEDESIIAMELEDRLMNMGYVVSGIVSSSESAMKKLEATSPDLILMDITIKGSMDGIELAAEVRSRFNIPVVYLTAYADDDTLQRAKQTTPFGYLLKPFREDELRAAIEIAVHKHRADAYVREQAVIDSMTGLYNRRYLNEALLHEFYRAQRESSTVSVAMLDIDYLKQINDTHGHDAGDQVIIKVAQTIQLALRKSDLVCRYGGDEIAIILPGTPLVDAKGKLNIIVKRVNATSIYVGDVEIPISVSAGVAAAPDSANDPEELLRAADKALYLSKQSGRNQVHDAGEIS